MHEFLGLDIDTNLRRDFVRQNTIIVHAGENVPGAIYPANVLDSGPER